MFHQSCPTYHTSCVCRKFKCVCFSIRSRKTHFAQQRNTLGLSCEKATLFHRAINSYWYSIPALLKFNALAWKNNTLIFQTGSTHVTISCETTDSLANVTLQYKKIGDQQWVGPPSNNDSRLIQNGQVFTINELTKVDEGFYQCRAIKNKTVHHLLLGYLAFGKYS